MVRVLSAPPAAGEGVAKLIGTHNGNFHCDEALACAILRLTPEFGGDDTAILRTRDAPLLAGCAVVVDVGGEYLPERNRLDHHQPTFHGTMATSEAQYNTRLSSAGLVYKHYGRAVLAALLGPEVGERSLDVVYDRVYKFFIEHVDGIDNGVEEYGLAPGAPEGASLVQNYRVTTTLSHRVGRLFPAWNEDTSPEKENERFAKAMELVAEEFHYAVHYYGRVWLPARSVVEQALAGAEAVLAGGAVAVLERYCPWQEHLFELEEALGAAGRTLYVLYPEGGKRGYRVHCVGVRGTKFTNRKSLPQPWQGLRDAALSAAAGVDGCTFVHATGFIGGNATYEGTLEMARKAVAFEA